MANLQTPVKATLVPPGTSLETFADTPGSYQLAADASGIYYFCPCGCGQLRYVGFRGKTEPERPSWVWNGDVNAPTLQPSIRHLNGCKYHGFLTEGVWKFEADTGK